MAGAVDPGAHVLAAIAAARKRPKMTIGSHLAFLNSTLARLAISAAVPAR